MKRIILLCVAVLLTILPATASATFLDSNTNLSAEWVRMQARVGSCDSLDAISYNPAGTVKMDDGFYMSFSNQMMPKDYSHEYGGTKYSTNTFTPLVPGMFALYKKDKWSWYGGMNVIGGGGYLEYNDSIFSKTPAGIINLTPGMKSTYGSVFLGVTAGGAYAISNTLSVSLGLRAVHATNSLEIEEGDILEYEKDATGIAPIIGINYSPSPKWNIGLRHEFRTNLDFEVGTLKGPMAPALEAQGIYKGFKNRKDLPALTGLGVSYMASSQLKLAADIHYCWQENVTWEQDPKAGNAAEVAFGAEYAFKPTFKVSGGYSYVDAKLDVDDYSTVLGKNPYHVLATGFIWSPMEKMNLDFGVSKLFYDNQTDNNGITYKKDLWIFGMALQYKFW